MLTFLLRFPGCRAIESVAPCLDVLRVAWSPKAVVPSTHRIPSIESKPSCEWISSELQTPKPARTSNRELRTDELQAQPSFLVLFVSHQWLGGSGPTAVAGGASIG